MKPAIFLALFVAATSSSTPVDVTAQFASLAPRLKAKTHIPVLLPRQLPSSFRGEKLYLIIEKLGTKAYSVDVALAPDCNGEHACSGGHINGSSAAPRGGSTVTLRPGIVAHYTPSIVTAYPTDAHLIWQQGSAYYDVSMPASLSDLLIVARSMKRF